MGVADRHSVRNRGKDDRADLATFKRASNAAWNKMILTRKPLLLSGLLEMQHLGTCARW